MNVIQPFKRRVILEAVIKGILIGLLVAGLIMVGVAAMYVVTYENILVLAIGIPLAVLCSIVTSIPVFLISMKAKLSQLNHRLDGLGLQERVTTMAEYRHDTSYVAQVQREDALARLGEMRKSDLKIKTSKGLISAISILLIFAILLFLLATPISAALAPVITPTQEEQSQTEEEIQDEIIQDMIEELDKIIEETPIPEEDKETIKDIIEDMKEKLDKAETNEEKMDIIKDTSNDLQFEVEKNEHNKQEIVDNLKQENDKLDPVEQENIKDLANAIEKGDREEINEALDKIYEDIMSNPDAESREESANDYANAIDKALQNTYNDEALKDALQDLTGNLKDQDTAINPGDLKDAFEQAKEDIDNALTESEMNKEVFDKVEDTREEILGTTDKTIEDVLDDLRDVINNSDLTHSDKNELHDKVDDLENKLEQMQQNGASNWEIAGEMTETREEIMDYIENAKNENNELGDNLQDTLPRLPDELQDAADQLGEAIKNNDKNAMNEALDKMQDYYQQTQQGSDVEREAVGDIKDMIDDALDRTEGKTEIGDILEDFSDKLGETLEGENEDIREGADNAFNDLREDLNSQLGSNADKEQTGEWMDDILQEGQNSILGNGKYEKPEEPKPNDQESEDKGEGNKGENNENQEPTEKPEDSDNQEGGGSSIGNLDLDFQIWDPQLQQFVPLGQYLTLQMIQDEYDKMFNRCDNLTQEEMNSIQAYYVTLEAAVKQYRIEHGLPLE